MSLLQRFQLRLRTLLFLIVPIAFLVAVVGYHVQEGRRQRAVVAGLEAELGGKGECEFVSGNEQPRFQLLDTGYLLRIRSVDLNRSDGRKNFTDLTPLGEFKNLETLDLSGTDVFVLSPLAKLKNLRTLNLRDTQVSDLSPLADLKNLRQLSLGFTQVSDLSPLASLNNL